MISAVCILDTIPLQRWSPTPLLKRYKRAAQALMSGSMYADTRAVAGKLQPNVSMIYVLTNSVNSKAPFDFRFLHGVFVLCLMTFLLFSPRYAPAMHQMRRMGSQMREDTCLTETAASLRIQWPGYSSKMPFSSLFPFLRQIFAHIASFTALSIFKLHCGVKCTCLFF